jgi:hypothetical protein
MCVTNMCGNCDVDRFAAAHNADCTRFNFMFGTVGAEAVDAFSQVWSLGRSYILPDFHAMGKVLDHIEHWNATATLIVPEWPAEQCWHRIWSHATHVTGYPTHVSVARWRVTRMAVV